MCHLKKAGIVLAVLIYLEITDYFIGFCRNCNILINYFIDTLSNKSSSSWFRSFGWHGTFCWFSWSSSSSFLWSLFFFLILLLLFFIIMILDFLNLFFLLFLFFLMFFVHALMPLLILNLIILSTPSAIPSSTILSFIV